jgi:hypothetical protein
MRRKRNGKIREKKGRLRRRVRRKKTKGQSRMKESKKTKRKGIR